MDLGKLRKQVDRIDREIVSLLNRRMEYALRTRKLKEVTAAPARESEVISQVKNRLPGLINAEFTGRLFQDILGESRRLQDLDLRLIGFAGEHGSYSEGAVRAYDDKAVAIPHSDFSEVFSGVESGVLDLGVVPVENSLAGNVVQVDQLLTETELTIVGELIRPIHHTLLAPPESDYRDIRIVYSHPMALAQCRGFIERNKLEARPYYDTAGSAMMISKDRPLGAAAIASNLCAELYDLEILKENIEDAQSNMTRFLVLSRKPLDDEGDKCTIVFTTAHKPGALFQMLRVFSDAKINLTRIESRPTSQASNNVAFLLDFLGSANDPTVRKALDELNSHAGTFKLLGCYKAAEVP